jgi:transcription elongation factor GreA
MGNDFILYTKKKKLIYFFLIIGKGLIGKNKNNIVEIQTPAGKKIYEVKSVKYV